MSWLEEILKAFNHLGPILRYEELYGYIKAHSTRELPPSWRDIIRRTIQNNSSDSRAFTKNKDIFYSVNGIGKGVWGLRQHVLSTPKAPDINDENSVPAERVPTEIYRILRDTKLTRTLKVWYNNKCQICGNSVSHGSFNYSEAHHIKPLGAPHNGPDSLDNLIILCANHHVEFDYGLIAIDPDGKLIHKDSTNDYFGRLIYTINEHTISLKYIRYHYDEIYLKKRY